MEAVREGLKQESEAVNRERKLKQEVAGRELRSLEESWLSHVNKNAEIETACLSLEADLARLRASLLLRCLLFLLSLLPHPSPSLPPSMPLYTPFLPPCCPPFLPPCLPAAPPSLPPCHLLSLPACRPPSLYPSLLAFLRSSLLLASLPPSLPPSRVRSTDVVDAAR